MAVPYNEFSAFLKDVKNKDAEIAPQTLANIVPRLTAAQSNDLVTVISHARPALAESVRHIVQQSPELIQRFEDAQAWQPLVDLVTRTKQLEQGLGDNAGEVAKTFYRLAYTDSRWKPKSAAELRTSYAEVWREASEAIHVFVHQTEAAKGKTLWKKLLMQEPHLGLYIFQTALNIGEHRPDNVLHTLRGYEIGDVSLVLQRLKALGVQTADIYKTADAHTVHNLTEGTLWRLVHDGKIEEDEKVVLKQLLEHYPNMFYAVFGGLTKPVWNADQLTWLFQALNPLLHTKTSNLFKSVQHAVQQNIDYIHLANGGGTFVFNGALRAFQSNYQENTALTDFLKLVLGETPPYNRLLKSVDAAYLMTAFGSPETQSHLPGVKVVEEKYRENANNARTGKGNTFAGIPMDSITETGGGIRASGISFWGKPKAYEQAQQLREVVTAVQTFKEQAAPQGPETKFFGMLGTVLGDQWDKVIGQVASALQSMPTAEGKQPLTAAEATAWAGGLKTASGWVAPKPENVGVDDQAFWTAVGEAVKPFVVDFLSRKQKNPNPKAVDSQATGMFLNPLKGLRHSYADFSSKQKPLQDIRAKLDAGTASVNELLMGKTALYKQLPKVAANPEYATAMQSRLIDVLRDSLPSMFIDLTSGMMVPAIAAQNGARIDEVRLAAQLAGETLSADEAAAKASNMAKVAILMPLDRACSATAQERDTAQAEAQQYQVLLAARAVIRVRQALRGYASTGDIKPVLQAVETLRAEAVQAGAFVTVAPKTAQQAPPASEGDSIIKEFAAFASEEAKQLLQVIKEKREQAQGKVDTAAEKQLLEATAKKLSVAFEALVSKLTIPNFGKEINRAEGFSDDALRAQLDARTALVADYGKNFHWIERLSEGIANQLLRRKNPKELADGGTPGAILALQDNWDKAIPALVTAIRAMPPAKGVPAIVEQEAQAFAEALKRPEGWTADKPKSVGLDSKAFWKEVAKILAPFLSLPSSPTAVAAALDKAQTLVRNHPAIGWGDLTAAVRDPEGIPIPPQPQVEQSDFGDPDIWGDVSRWADRRNWEVAFVSHMEGGINTTYTDFKRMPGFSLVGYAATALPAPWEKPQNKDFSQYYPNGLLSKEQAGFGEYQGHFRARNLTRSYKNENAKYVPLESDEEKQGFDVFWVSAYPTSMTTSEVVDRQALIVAEIQADFEQYVGGVENLLTSVAGETLSKYNEVLNGLDSVEDALKNAKTEEERVPLLRQQEVLKEQENHLRQTRIRGRKLGGANRWVSFGVCPKLEHKVWEAGKGASTTTTDPVYLDSLSRCPLCREAEERAAAAERRPENPEAYQYPKHAAIPFDQLLLARQTLRKAREPFSSVAYDGLRFLTQYALRYNDTLTKSKAKFATDHQKALDIIAAPNTTPDARAKAELARDEAAKQITAYSRVYPITALYGPTGLDIMKHWDEEGDFLRLTEPGEADENGNQVEQRYNIEEVGGGNREKRVMMPRSKPLFDAVNDPVSELGQLVPATVPEGSSAPSGLKAPAVFQGERLRVLLSKIPNEVLSYMLEYDAVPPLEGTRCPNHPGERMIMHTLSEADTEYWTRLLVFARQNIDTASIPKELAQLEAVVHNIELADMAIEKNLRDHGDSVARAQKAVERNDLVGDAKTALKALQEKLRPEDQKKLKLFGNIWVCPKTYPRAKHPSITESAQRVLSSAQEAGEQNDLIRILKVLKQDSETRNRPLFTALKDLIPAFRKWNTAYRPNYDNVFLAAGGKLTTLAGTAEIDQGWKVRKMYRIPLEEAVAFFKRQRIRALLAMLLNPVTVSSTVRVAARRELDNLQTGVLPDERRISMYSVVQEFVEDLPEALLGHESRLQVYSRLMSRIGLTQPEA